MNKRMTLRTAWLAAEAAAWVVLGVIAYAAWHLL